MPSSYEAAPAAVLAPNPSSLRSIDFSDYGADPLDLVDLDSRRVAWIHPPPVMRAAENQKWEKWVEKAVDGQLFVVKVGCSHSNMESASYFDRSNHREVILLEEARPLPGAVSRTEIFGLPCPRHLHFAETPQNKNPCPAKASYWLYLTRTPASCDVGLKAATPDVNSLPYKDEFRPGSVDRPPSPPPSPGNPGPLAHTPTLSFDSPSIRGLDDSNRPISPMDSLLESPRPVNWDIVDDKPMGPQIPGISSEDIEMSAVDLGYEPLERTVPTPPQVESPPISQTQSPRRTMTPSPSRQSQHDLRASSRPISSNNVPRPARRSPSGRSERKHSRRRLRTPSPPRRRGDSYRPSALHHNYRDDRRPYH